MEDQDVALDRTSFGKRNIAYAVHHRCTWSVARDRDLVSTTCECCGESDASGDAAANALHIRCGAIV
jgi:hypothetical protein